MTERGDRVHAAIFMMSHVFIVHDDSPPTLNAPLHPSELGRGNFSCYTVAALINFDILAGASVARIFISYSSKDRAIVGKLAEDLSALGHDLWYDKELSRTGGQSWWDNILAQIRDHDLINLLCGGVDNAPK